MSALIWILLAGAAGYAAAVVTWPRVRPWLIGLDNEIAHLRAKARELENRLRG